MLETKNNLFCNIMIVKIFNVNIIIILFIENLVYELNYLTPFSTTKKYIYGWVYFNSKKYGWIEINTNAKGFNKIKICPNSEILIFIEDGIRKNNKELKIKFNNYNFYYHPKYESFVPEWLPSNVIQLLNFIENNKVAKVISQSNNDKHLRNNLSKLAGFLYQDTSSQQKIISFINTYAIDMNKYKIESWNNLNDFLKRDLIDNPVLKEDNMLYSPVEGLLKIITEDNFYVKGNYFDFVSLVQQKIHFNHSILFRMIPSDYHKVHCPYKLKLINIKYIDGDLYSIRPNTIVENNALVNNKRCVLTFTDKDDYTVYMILVGSIFIGSIYIHKEKINKWINPGEEIGYFKFGGSSVILLLEKDLDYRIKTYNNYETKMEFGTLIGCLNKTKKIIYNYDKTIKLTNTTKDDHIKLILEISIYLFLYFFYKKFLTK